MWCSLGLIDSIVRSDERLCEGELCCLGHRRKVSALCLLYKCPSTRANLNADLPAKTGLRRQKRVCGHQNCTPRKLIRATCTTFKLRKLDCTVKYARVATGLQFFVVFLHEAIEKCKQVLVPRHDRCQQNHQMNWSLRILNYLQRVDTHQVYAGKSAIKFARVDGPYEWVSESFCCST